MRNKPVDICFVLDATNKNQSVCYALISKINDLVTDLNLHYKHADFQYGAVIFRDPIDFTPSPIPLNDEILRQLNENERINREERKRKLISENAWDEEFEERKEEYRRHIDRVRYPIDQNVAIEFDENIENLINELMKVECSGGNDNPEDWNGAIQCALNMNWRDESKKIIILISDANAHGKLFCGYDNHDEEENKLINAVKALADNQFYFIGINIKKGEDEGCKKTLRKIKDLYDDHSCRNFYMEEFRPIYDVFLYGDDEWPRTVSDNFIQTIQRTLLTLGNLDI